MNIKKLMTGILGGAIGVILMLVLLVALLGSGGDDSESTANIMEDSSASPGEASSVSEPGEDIFAYTNWTSFTAHSINDYYKAPSGYLYVVVTAHIKNIGTQTYSTNPNYWPLTADGITYNPDTATYSQEINHQTVQVGPGGDLETKFVYLVKGNPTEITLGYIGPTYPV